jgi:MHS family alpha-ketoglutarate permease-like MFS transporter
MAVASGALDNRHRLVAIVSSASGNLVEWYDFYVYSFCALYFADQFFPNGDRTTQLLNAAAVFAAGFLMRPIGGWLFGRIADRRGRRVSMVISVVMMCAGSFFIALLPTYAAIGVAAPILLLVARLAQGLSVGGEYGAVATYMSEVSVAGRRGLFSSFQYVTLIGGQLLAVLVLVLLQQVLDEQQLKAFGWRIPFAIGGLAAVVALLLRRALPETLSERTRGEESAGTLTGLWRSHRRAFLTVVGLTAGGSLSFYTFTSYMQKYLVNTAGMTAATASGTMTAALFAFMLMQPFFGWLSDRIGRRLSMMLFGGLAAIATMPLLRGIAGAATPAAAFGFIVLGLAIISLYTAISGIVKAELFSSDVRALGVGLPYAIANALFGGTAEYVALWFKASGREHWFGWYVMTLCTVVFAVAVLMPDARRYGYLQGATAD